MPPPQQFRTSRTFGHTYMLMRRVVRISILVRQLLLLIIINNICCMYLIHMWGFSQLLLKRSLHILDICPSVTCILIHLQSFYVYDRKYIFFHTWYTYSSFSIFSIKFKLKFEIKILIFDLEFVFLLGSCPCIATGNTNYRYMTL